VQFLGVYFKEKSQAPILIMERMWKNLYDVLAEQPNQLLLLTKTYILYDTVCGLNYLHNQKKPVVHRDLHPSNILLNENFNAKLADLGQAKPMDNAAAQKLSTAPGNLPYMAPETLRHKPIYDTKADIFSLGCTIIHLVTEKVPVPTDQFIESGNPDGSFQKVSETDRRRAFLDLMTNISSVLKQIAFNCLEDASTNRLTASEICIELEKYIQQVEIKAPIITKQHKQDKNSLLRMLQSQESQLENKEEIIKDLRRDKGMLDDAILKKEEYISSLESQCQDSKSELEEYKVNLLSLQRERDSLKKELANQDEMNKQLTTTYRNEADRLRKDLKMKLLKFKWKKK